VSSWVMQELAFARRHRLGIASVWPGAGSKLSGIGSARRWTLPGGAVEVSSPDGPVLRQPAADQLRDFFTRLHGETMVQRRRWGKYPFRTRRELEDLVVAAVEPDDVRLAVPF